MIKAGIIIFSIGVLITVFTGLDYVTKEVVLDAGQMDITRDVNHGFSWSPLIGVVILITGIVIFVFGIRKDKAK